MSFVCQPNIYKAILNTPNELSRYFSIAKICWKQYLSYRAHLIISLLSSALPLMGIYFLWVAIYSQNTSMELYYSVNQILTYTIIAFIVNIIISPFGIEWEISSDITEGLLTKYLLYPISYLKYRMVWLASEKLFSMLIRLPLIFLILYIIKDILVLPSAEYFLYFVTSLFLSFILYYLLSFCIGISAFWWDDVTGLFYVGNSIIVFFSGLLLPLNLFPENVVAVMKLLPFYFILFFPLEIFIQGISGGEIIEGLFKQTIWVAIIYWFTNFLFFRGLQKYEAFGG